MEGTLRDFRNRNRLRWREAVRDPSCRSRCSLCQDDKPARAAVREPFLCTRRPVQASSRVASRSPRQRSLPRSPYACLLVQLNQELEAALDCLSLRSSSGKLHRAIHQCVVDFNIGSHELCSAHRPRASTITRCSSAIETGFNSEMLAPAAWAALFSSGALWPDITIIGVVCDFARM
jgi:hypothetical protein